ncbi:hypothetical protein [Micromonospora sp. NPDC047730]|uniref:hypothetical protein n=1 Tax=Micromonospora sp. NPDC047730 TaxID=3364253 RepID=UPI00371B75EB
MRIKKLFGVVMLAGALAIPTAAVAACAPTEKTSNGAADCDVDDQRERDEDCGYYDEAGIWVWYPWVVQGQDSKPPKGWKAPKIKIGTQPTGKATGSRTSGASTQKQTSTTTRSNTTSTRQSTTGGSRTSGGSLGGGGRRR